LSSIKKVRLDAALVERELAESRQKAQALILSGKVTVNGQRADKPGHAVAGNALIVVEEALRYVSRGGAKLEAALVAFAVDPKGCVCMDVGTSTGGFTDCLLQHGALRVHAVDTGAGQIHWRLRTDERVILHEKTNARHLQFGEIGEPASLIVCDVSFIGVSLLIPALAPLLASGGDFIVLVKPQFEAGRAFVGEGGIVRDPLGHKSACDKVAETFAKLGFETRLTDSPILGAEGNREFLMHARRAAS
jgi:23S rRNA (cytidine1920-2'-O)/16S rRNA (cytidine1409-2'-O)-methyltransferase